MKTKLFIGAEAAIYLAFIAIELFGLPVDTTWIKYSGIIICVLYTFGKNLCFPAFILTAIADLFLLVLGTHLELGVGIFILAQLLHALRIKSENGRILLALRLLVPIVLCSAVSMAEYQGLLNSSQLLLYLLTAFYFSELLLNAGASEGVLKVGFILFILCDICVGLFNMISPNTLLYKYVSFGMWFFYLPSQILIAIRRRDNAI